MWALFELLIFWQQEHLSNANCCNRRCILTWVWTWELLQPRLNDMDMNQHVNNVKYIGWVLEVRMCLVPLHPCLVLHSPSRFTTARIVLHIWGLADNTHPIVWSNNWSAMFGTLLFTITELNKFLCVTQSVPQSLSVAHELTSMTLEYRRECTPSDIVQSLSCPDSPLPISNSSSSSSSSSSPSSSSSQQSHDNNNNGSALLGNGALDGSPGAVSCSSGALKSATLSPPTVMRVHYTHLLRMQSDGTEILRGRTSWRLKQRYNNSSNNNGASHWVGEWASFAGMVWKLPM